MFTRKVSICLVEMMHFYTYSEHPSYRPAETLTCDTFFSPLPHTCGIFYLRHPWASLGDSGSLSTRSWEVFFVKSGAAGNSFSTKRKTLPSRRFVVGLGAPGYLSSLQWAQAANQASQPSQSSQPAQSTNPAHQ